MEPQLYRDFARLEDVHWWFTGRRAVIRAVLKDHLPPHPMRRILDVGCGTGGMLKMLTEFGQAEGLEASDQALELCRERVGASIPVHRGELPDGIPVGNKYEVITAFDVLEHLDEPVAALKAIHRAMASGGDFICTVPAYDFLWSEHDDLNHHRRRYTRRLLLEQLKEGGFKPLYASYFNSALFSPIALARLASKALGRRSGKSDMSEAPALVNRLLERIFSAERFVVPHVPLPFGVSLLAIAKRREIR